MRRFVFCALVIGTAAPAVQAEGPTEKLVRACSELVGIYSQREQKSLLAGWTASVSDALQAGYCRGVLDEFRRTNSCNTSNWHTQAQRIAQTTPALISGDSLSDLLAYSCAI